METHRNNRICKNCLRFILPLYIRFFHGFMQVRTF